MPPRAGAGSARSNTRWPRGVSLRSRVDPNSAWLDYARAHSSPALSWVEGGARWHTAREVRELFAGLPVKNLTLRSAIYLPSGSGFAVRLERGVPSMLPWGGLLLASEEKI